MVAFRRVITALAVLALFTGLASAQVGGSGQSQLTCSTNVAVTPQLRGEGYTEQRFHDRAGWQHSVGQHYGFLQCHSDQPPAGHRHDQRPVRSPPAHR